MKILVTGGNGFVGKELIRSILSQGIHTPVSGVRKINKVEDIEKFLIKNSKI